MDHVNPETAARQKRDRDAAQRTTVSQAVVHGLVFGLLNAVAVWVAVGGLLFGGDWLVDQGKSIAAGAFWGTSTAVCFYVFVLFVWLSPRKRSWFGRRPRQRKLQDMIPAGMSRATIALILCSFVAACALLGVIIMVGGSLETLLKKEPNRTLALLLTTIGTSVLMGLLVSAGSYYWLRSQQSTVTPFDRPHEL